MGKDLKGKELGIGISQRKDGYYLARYTSITGERIQKLFKKYHECRLWYSNAILEDSSVNRNISRNITVDGWYSHWEKMKEDTVLENTLESYKAYYKKHIKPILGQKKLSEVKTNDCQNVLSAMAKKDYKSSTIRDIRNVMRNMFEYAVQCDVMNKNPCSYMIKTDIGKKTIPRKALSKEEHKKFLMYANASIYGNVYKFALQTGLRCGEIIGLQWNDINFEEGYIYVSRTAHYDSEKKLWYYGDTKTACGNRTVPLTSEARRILLEQKENNKKIGMINIRYKNTVFLTKKGVPAIRQQYDLSIKVVCKRAGIRDISMHILRHTFATRCAENGMSPKTLQTIMGHSDISVTMNIYVDITNEQKIKEVADAEKSLMAI